MRYDRRNENTRISRFKSKHETSLTSGGACILATRVALIIIIIIITMIIIIIITTGKGARSSFSQKTRQPVRHSCVSPHKRLNPEHVGVGWYSLYADIGAPGQFRKIMPGDQARPFFPTKNHQASPGFYVQLFFLSLSLSLSLSLLIPFSVVPFSRSERALLLTSVLLFWPSSERENGEDVIDDAPTGHVEERTS